MALIWVFLACVVFYALFLVFYVCFINLFPKYSPEKFSGRTTDDDIDLLLSSLFLEQ